MLLFSLGIFATWERRSEDFENCIKKKMKKRRKKNIDRQMVQFGQKQLHQPSGNIPHK